MDMHCLNCDKELMKAPAFKPPPTRFPTTFATPADCSLKHKAGFVMKFRAAAERAFCSDKAFPVAAGYVAYFEATLTAVTGTTAVAVGLVTDEGWYSSETFPGWTEGSLGWHSDDGRFYLNGNGDRSWEGVDSIVEGSVVGCGQLATGDVFCTLNGRLFATGVSMHPGMRAVVAADGHADVKVNLGQEAFVFECRRLLGRPELLQEAEHPSVISAEEEGKGAEEGKEDLPAAALISSDSLSLIMQFLCVSPEHFRVASVVCREWHEQLSERAVSNVIWSGLAKRRWVFIPDSTKVRNWLKFYRRRHEAVRATSEADRKSSAHVMNCLEWELNCPIAADKLGPLRTGVFGGSATQYCSVCKEDVHLVQLASEVAGHLEAGYCMTFDLGRTMPTLPPPPPVQGRMRMPELPVHARPPRPVPSRPMPGGLPLPPPE
eukprot:PLAT12517.3.p1 GENE.PLAT12517.3~~PLAT12517.3.p1  ORF type:complete len:464 (-),score=61.15 PLAT12517.3:88-1386(-)